MSMWHGSAVLEFLHHTVLQKVRIPMNSRIKISDLSADRLPHSLDGSDLIPLIPFSDTAKGEVLKELFINQDIHD